MLSLFKNNRPITFLFLVAYFIVLKANVFVVPAEVMIEPTAPFGELVFNFLDTLGINAYPYLQIIALLCIFIQALMLNSIVNRVKLYGEFNFIPSLSYILLTSWFAGFNYLSPTLIAAFPVIFSFGKVLKLIGKENFSSDLFDASFWIAIASLFWFPAIQFLFWLFLSVGMLKTFNIKTWLAGFSGFVIPYFLTATYFFWNGLLTDFVEIHILSFINQYTILIEVDNIFWIRLIVLLIVSLWFIWLLSKELPVQVMHLRIAMGVVFTMLMFSVFTIVLQPIIRLQHFFLLIIPLSLIYSYQFSLKRKYELGEWIHLSLFILLLITQYINFVEIKNPFT